MIYFFLCVHECVDEMMECALICFVLKSGAMEEHVFKYCGKGHTAWKLVDRREGEPLRSFASGINLELMMLP